MAGYTVIWTLCLWLAGDPWAALPGLFVAFKIAQAVQAVIDSFLRKFFLDNRREAS